LHENSEPAGHQPEPPSFSRDLSATARQWLVQGRAEHELGNLLRACAAVGIEPIVVKGFALAHKQYDDSAARPLADVDLRVLARELAPACRAMEAIGFRVTARSHVYGNAVLMREGQYFDLETQVGPPYFTRLSVADIRSRQLQITTARGLSFYAPDLTDHALVLAVNVFKDKFTGAPTYALRDARDIPLAAGFSADQLVQRAHDCKMNTLLYLVADWFSQRGAAHWTPIAVALRATTSRVNYLRLMHKLLTQNHTSSMALRLATRLVPEDRSDRARCTLCTAAFALESATKRYLRTR
jgi:Uncharacterised nucleotidyltransferase